MQFQAPRGTHDVLPSESHRWQYLERTFAGLVELYGYREIRTPAFEDTELFVRSSGETSDIVSKQMYTFIDKGGRSVTLKPEGTAPSIRSYLEHHLGDANQINRLWYQTQIFRYERPQKGRYREAHQLGIELIGSPSPLADAEVIELTVRFYQTIGFEKPTVLLNSLGREQTRAQFRTAILKHAASWLKDQSEEDRARAERNPLRLLDSKSPEIQAMMQGSAQISDFLEDDSRDHFRALQNHLDGAGISYRVAPEIVRGLDYYTDTVFEVQSESLGAQSALCGGGRYDNLIEQLGGPPTASVGVALGIERALIALEADDEQNQTPLLEAYVVAAFEGARCDALQLARELRSDGISAQCDLDRLSLRAQVKQADKLQARFALIIGESELASRTVTVKRLADGHQISSSREDLPATLKALS